MGIKLAKAGWELGTFMLQTDGLLAEQDTICSEDLGDTTRKWMQKAAHKPDNNTGAGSAVQGPPHL